MIEKDKNKILLYKKLLILSMNHLILFTLIYLILQNKYINAEKSFSRFRNSLLKTACVVSVKKEQLNELSYKLIKNTQSKIVDLHKDTLNKCCNMNVIYNSLTENEREFVEAIMLLIV